jgi:DNA repair photolyase
MKSVIYETKGRAREFNELAINLFTGCDHACVYCYGADVLHTDKAKFVNEPKERVTDTDVFNNAKEWVARGETRRVLLCFITDPYQKCEQATQLTRKCIMRLHEVGLNVIILTKGGNRSIRDFDLLTSKDAYATTLTLTDDTQSLKWESGAGLPMERINALKEAHKRGIETWVSFEPVIYPTETMKLVQLTKDFVDHYKVGTMNYHPQGKNTNWREYGWYMKRYMDSNNIKYYFKKDLLREMGVLPENFNQTWICK